MHGLYPPGLYFLKKYYTKGSNITAAARAHALVFSGFETIPNEL